MRFLLHEMELQSDYTVDNLLGCNDVLIKNLVDFDSSADATRNLVIFSPDLALCGEKVPESVSDRHVNGIDHQATSLVINTLLEEIFDNLKIDSEAELNVFNHSSVDDVSSVELGKHYCIVTETDNYCNVDEVGPVVECFVDCPLPSSNNVVISVESVATKVYETSTLLKPDGDPFKIGRGVFEHDNKKITSETGLGSGTKTHYASLVENGIYFENENFMNIEPDTMVFESTPSTGKEEFLLQRPKAQLDGSKNAEVSFSNYGSNASSATDVERPHICAEKLQAESEMEIHCDDDDYPPLSSDNSIESAVTKASGCGTLTLFKAPHFTPVTNFESRSKQRKASCAESDSGCARIQNREPSARISASNVISDEEEFIVLRLRALLKGTKIATEKHSNCCPPTRSNFSFTIDVQRPHDSAAKLQAETEMKIHQDDDDCPPLSSDNIISLESVPEQSSGNKTSALLRASENCNIVRKDFEPSVSDNQLTSRSEKINPEYTSGSAKILNRQSSSRISTSNVINEDEEEFIVLRLRALLKGTKIATEKYSNCCPPTRSNFSSTIDVERPHNSAAKLQAETEMKIHHDDDDCPPLSSDNITSLESFPTQSSGYKTSALLKASENCNIVRKDFEPSVSDHQLTSRPEKINPEYTSGSAKILNRQSSSRISTSNVINEDEEEFVVLRLRALLKGAQRAIEKPSNCHPTNSNVSSTIIVDRTHICDNAKFTSLKEKENTEVINSFFNEGQPDTVNDGKPSRTGIRPSIFDEDHLRMRFREHVGQQKIAFSMAEDERETSESSNCNLTEESSNELEAHNKVGDKENLTNSDVSSVTALEMDKKALPVKKNANKLKERNIPKPKKRNKSEKPTREKAHNSNAEGDSKKPKAPKNEEMEEKEITPNAIGVVVSKKGDEFSVKVEEGPSCIDRNLRCFNKHLADPTIPIIVHKTRLLLGLRIRTKNRQEIVQVLWANPYGYNKITSADVTNAFDSPENESHEQFIRKLYFSWRPFFQSILIHASEFDGETMALVLKKILPPDTEARPFRNKLAELRFQKIMEMVGSQESSFLFQLGKLDSFDPILVKRIVLLVMGNTKNSFSSIHSLLDIYYTDDPKGLIELIKRGSNEYVQQSLTASNYRDVPLIPVMEELNGVINTLIKGSSCDSVEQSLLQLESHVIPNRIDGPWDSAEEFLNAHFRLLREECFASIRNRIANLRANRAGCNYVHRDISVVRFAISDGTIVVELKYKPHKSRSNMMFGNLLCIDVDHRFSNPIWATVHCAEAKSTKIGVTVVGVGNNYAEGCSNGTNDADVPTAEILVSAIQRLMCCKSGVMVESQTYYRAFKPVLSRLQGLEENEFPFETEVLLKSIEPQLSPVGFSIDLERSRMDDSQMHAAKSALSNRFTLIQGPPGCGKTYVTKEIIKAMLKQNVSPKSEILTTDSLFGRKNIINHSRLKFNPTMGPILLLTYKNHALDTLIEGCLGFTTSVVRIGGKARSSIAAEYNLHQVKRNSEAKQYYSDEDFKKLQEAKRQLGELEDELRYTARGLLLNEFTATALHSVLEQSEVGRQQLKSLLLNNFAKHYGKIIKQDVKYSFTEQIEKAVTDIMSNPRKDLAVKLLQSAMKEWLPDSGLSKFLPTRRRSLFMQNTSSTKEEEEKQEEPEDELVEEEWETVFAERKIGMLAELKFITLSQKDSQLYPKLVNRMCDLEVDPQESDVREILDVWSLTTEGRFILLAYWLRHWREEKDQQLSKVLDKYRRFHEQVQELQHRRNVKFLKTRDLVGCTITGSCIHMGLIAEVAPSVVIVEEAAEILEGQLIAALPSSVKHVVLVGDHRQLPPQVNHYRLARNFNLGVSIFERLANNGFPVCQLKVHRRGPKSLCPLFSKFYEQEIEAPNPDPILPKILQRIGNSYWWTHNAPACTPANGTSFENEYEAEMLVGAVRFLIWGGKVGADRISIITGYLAQSKRIQGLLHKCKIENVFVCTIDQYQGDENDYIFLSLTRSVYEMGDETKQPSLGFLSSKNRTCVALSRARKGLYIFGCSSLFEKHSSWKDAVDYFKTKKRLGNELHFVGDRKLLLFSDPYDFKQFFKELELQKKIMKIDLHNRYIKELPAISDGVQDVTKSFGKMMEDLMNGSVLNRRDLGQGRDAHGEKFNSFKVVKVQKIFNTDRYALYRHHQDIIKAKKPKPLGFAIDSVAEWMTDSLNPNVNEVYLFHGTNPDTAKKIKESGFDDRLARGGLFGSGIYFAENADKSDQYAKSPPYMIFLSRVTLGEPYKTTTNGNWVRPPEIHPSKPTELYDSIIAVSGRKSKGPSAVLRHQEFVIFDRYHCLPEYLIEYQRR